MTKQAVATIVIAIVGCFGITSSASGSIAKSSASWKSCGFVSVSATWNVKAKRTSCSTARKVARKAGRKLMKSTQPPFQARGFRCKRIGGYNDGGYYRCKRGNRMVRFSFGG